MIGTPGGGALVILGGYGFASVAPRATGNTLATFVGPGTIEIGRATGFTWRSDCPSGAPNFYLNRLAQNVSPTSTHVGTLILWGFVDTTPIDRVTGKAKSVLSSGSAGAGYAPYAQIILHLRNVTLPDGTVLRCKLGDIGQLPTKGLFAAAGSEFGCGNRSGPEIDAALAALALVDGVDFSISGQTTIVGQYGEIISQPGWK